MFVFQKKVTSKIEMVDSLDERSPEFARMNKPTFITLTE